MAKTLMILSMSGESANQIVAAGPHHGVLKMRHDRDLTTTAGTVMDFCFTDGDASAWKDPNHT